MKNEETVFHHHCTGICRSLPFMYKIITEAAVAAEAATPAHLPQLSPCRELLGQREK